MVNNLSAKQEAQAQSLGQEHVHYSKPSRGKQPSLLGKVEGVARRGSLQSALQAESGTHAPLQVGIPPAVFQ